MALSVTLKVPGRSDTAQGQMALDTLAEALTQINVDWLKTHPEAPDLADAGVRYDLHADVQGPWQSIPELYRKGRGDCEDIAIARAAELRVRYGVHARACMMHWDHSWDASQEGRWSVHWVVCLPDGSTEDPASALSRGPKVVTTTDKQLAAGLAAATAVLVVGIVATRARTG